MSLPTSKILIFVHVAGDVFVAVNENGELSSVGHILRPQSVSHREGKDTRYLDTI